MLHDVSAQGRVLVGRTTAQREIVGRAPGETRDRALSWLDWSFPTALSDDGRFVLFEEQNLGNEYGLFLRRTDGAPPVRLGDGRGLALSPDGRWVLATHQVEGATELVLLPTGAGETRRVGRPAIVARAPRSCRAASGWWSPATRRARESGCYTLRPRDGRARPDQPRGHHGLLQRDGRPPTDGWPSRPGRTGS